MEIAINVCKCGGNYLHHDFSMSEYLFPDGSSEILPDLCPENDHLSSDLFQQFKPLLKTLESNENWTMFSHDNVARANVFVYYSHRVTEIECPCQRRSEI